VELVPGRYARNEQSSGFVAAMDTYVYRAPVAQLSPLTLGESAPEPATPKVDDATPR
jgi:hypothetical protein